MRVIVVGGGLVGSSLAEKLSADGHDVVLVEQDRNLVAELNDRLDVQTICGNGATTPVLLQAGIENSDLLLATTDSDEANMVVALVGSELFEVPKVVARLRDLERSKLERWLSCRADGGMSARSRNAYRAAIVAFCNWCVQTNRRTSNPFQRIPKANEKADPRHQRRALTEDELVELLDVARRRPLLDAMTIRRGERKGQAVAKLSDNRFCAIALGLKVSLR